MSRILLFMLVQLSNEINKILYQNINLCTDRTVKKIAYQLLGPPGNFEKYLIKEVTLSISVY